MRRDQLGARFFALSPPDIWGLVVGIPVGLFVAILAGIPVFDGIQGSFQSFFQSVFGFLFALAALGLSIYVLYRARGFVVLGGALTASLGQRIGGESAKPGNKENSAVLGAVIGVGAFILFMFWAIQSFVNVLRAIGEKVGVVVGTVLAFLVAIVCGTVVLAVLGGGLLVAVSTVVRWVLSFRKPPGPGTPRQSVARLLTSESISDANSLRSLGGLRRGSRKAAPIIAGTFISDDANNSRSRLRD